jgi:hypothetical protein
VKWLVFSNEWTESAKGMKLIPKQMNVRPRRRRRGGEEGEEEEEEGAAGRYGGGYREGERKVR